MTQRKRREGEKQLIQSRGSLLQLGPLIWNDRTCDRTHLQTNTAVNAGIKINPKPISTLDIFARAGVNASNRTSADAISNSLANIRNDSMWHISILDFGFWMRN
jgi:hypothetical protein